jgi:hypothetical protein
MRAQEFGSIPRISYVSKVFLSYGQRLGYSPYDAGANITVCSDAAQRDAVLAKQHLQFSLSSKLTRGGTASSLPQPL